MKAEMYTLLERNAKVHVIAAGFGLLAHYIAAPNQ